MVAGNLYAIRYVAQRTGLTTHVIRAWEKRYQAVVPHRSPKNRRLYSDSDINRFQFLKKVTAAGHSISQVAKLSTEDLSNLARREALITPTMAENEGQTKQSADYDHYDACLTAVLRLDPESFEYALGQAAINLTRPSLLKKIIAPLFAEIGNLWRNGSLKIINEHMASSVTRTFLVNMLRSAEIDDTAPKIVVATLPGQWHEIGALCVALTAAESGWKANYYGPNLPAEEIAAGVKHLDARAVAISIMHLLEHLPCIEELRKLRRYLGNQVGLFVGGRAVEVYKHILEEIDAKYIENFEHFQQELDSLMSARAE